MPTQTREIKILIGDAITGDMLDMAPPTPHIIRPAIRPIIVVENISKIDMAFQVRFPRIGEYIKHIGPGETAIFGDDQRAADEGDWDEIWANTEWRIGCDAFVADELGRPRQIICKAIVIVKGPEAIHLACDDIRIAHRAY